MADSAPRLAFLVCHALACRLAQASRWPDSLTLASVAMFSSLMISRQLFVVVSVLIASSSFPFVSGMVPFCELLARLVEQRLVELVAQHTAQRGGLALDGLE